MLSGTVELIFEIEVAFIARAQLSTIADVDFQNHDSYKRNLNSACTVIIIFHLPFYALLSSVIINETPCSWFLTWEFFYVGRLVYFKKRETFNVIPRASFFWKTA